jgi:transcription termination/antitermination protein NusA
LYEKGFFSAHELSKASVEDLTQIRDITEEKAIQLIDAAEEHILSKDHAAETSEEAVPEESDDDHDIQDVSDSSKAAEDQPGSDENVAKQTILTDDKEADSAEQ